MKRIEAVVTRATLNDLCRCAKQLGIFGFDLSEDHTKDPDYQRRHTSQQTNAYSSRLVVDFAVPDEAAKPTIHALLESVHPESVAIFKIDENTDSKAGYRA